MPFSCIFVPLMRGFTNINPLFGFRHYLINAICPMIKRMAGSILISGDTWPPDKWHLCILPSNYVFVSIDLFHLISLLTALKPFSLPTFSYELTLFLTLLSSNNIDELCSIWTNSETSLSGAVTLKGIFFFWSARYVMKASLIIFLEIQLSFGTLANSCACFDQGSEIVHHITMHALDNCRKRQLISVHELKKSNCWYVIDAYISTDTTRPVDIYENMYVHT